MNKTDIKEFIITHLNIQRLSKEFKKEKEQRKSLEQNLYKEFKKRELNSFDFEKYRVYAYDIPVPRLMVYRIKS